MFPPTLTTQRLVLRPPRLEDADALFERYASDPDATQYLSWKTHESVEEMRKFLAEELAEEGKQRDTHWVICRAGEDDPWGMATAFATPSHLVELGYVLARPLWGRGLMTEAVRAVIDAAWRREEVWRVAAIAHVDNVGSQRVLEKCGLRREGVSRRLIMMPQCGAAPQDCVRYAQVRDDLPILPGPDLAPGH